MAGPSVPAPTGPQPPVPSPAMDRVAVIGSGKSVPASHLGARLGVPVTRLDSL